MGKFEKFNYASKSYLIINKVETFNQSKDSCLYQGYEFANIDEKAMNFVKEKLLNSALNDIKFFLQTNVSTSIPERYTLLTRFANTTTVDEIYIKEDYNFESNTLCEKINEQVNNTTSIYSSSTTQIINTSSNNMLVVVFVIIIVALLTSTVVALYLLKRRNNNSSNQVSLF